MTAALLERLRLFFSTQPIEKAWVFGSYARGEARVDSDVDIMVSYTEGTRLGLLGIAELEDNLGKILGKRVDLVEEGTLYPRVAKEVEMQKKQIYER